MVLKYLIKWSSLEEGEKRCLNDVLKVDRNKKRMIRRSVVKLIQELTKKFAKNTDTKKARFLNHFEE